METQRTDFRYLLRNWWNDLLYWVWIKFFEKKRSEEEETGRLEWRAAKRWFGLWRKQPWSRTYSDRYPLKRLYDLAQLYRTGKISRTEAMHRARLEVTGRWRAGNFSKP